MPQMAPINWLTSYFLFLMLFLMMTTLIYYSFISTPQINKYLKNKMNLNWKW